MAQSDYVAYLNWRFDHLPSDCGRGVFADGKRQQHGSVCRGAERDVRLYGRRPFR